MAAVIIFGAFILLALVVGAILDKTRDRPAPKQPKVSAADDALLNGCLPGHQLVEQIILNPNPGPVRLPNFMDDSFVNNSDDPIAAFEEDLLKRKPFVDRLGYLLKAAPKDSSNVFGLYGEWGSGKTSVKNLVLKRFAESQADSSTPLVVEFNPWAFSSQTELLQSFFSEISKKLGRKKAGDVAVAFDRLGAYLSAGSKTAKSLQLVADLALMPGGSLLGITAETLAKGGAQAEEYGNLLRKGEIQSLEDIQKDLSQALAKLPRPILIIIDDIDRLPPEQILQMFQVVRINSALPKINFLLLLDRNSVVSSLLSKGYQPDFLEKIVQFAINLPLISASDLRAFLKKGYQSILGKPLSSLDWSRWESAFDKGYCDILDTPRKARRALHTFRFHYSVFCQDGVPEVDLVDLFSLEVLRLYAPELWSDLSRAGRIFFGAGNQIWRLQERKDQDSTLAKAADELVKELPIAIRQGCRKILEALFPQIDQTNDRAHELEWIAACRLCTDIHFDSYFLLSASAAYPTQKEIEALAEKFNNYADLLVEVRNLAKNYGFEQMLAKLQARCRPETNVEQIKNILAATWRVDEESAASLGFEEKWDHRGQIDELSVSLLSRIKDATNRNTIAREALDLGNAINPLYSLTGRDLYYLDKVNPHAQDRTFSKETLIDLQVYCFDKIEPLVASDRLVYHPYLGALLNLWEKNKGAAVVREWVKKQAAEDDRLIAILKFFFTQSTSTNSRRYFIQREPVKRFFVLDDYFRLRLERIDQSRLDPWSKLAVSEALRNVRQELAGIEEARYPDAE